MCVREFVGCVFLCVARCLHMCGELMGRVVLWVWQEQRELY